MEWDAPTVVIGVLGLVVAMLGLFVALLVSQVNNLKGDMRDSEKRLSDALRAEVARLEKEFTKRLTAQEKRERSRSRSVLAEELKRLSELES